MHTTRQRLIVYLLCAIAVVTSFWLFNPVHFYFLNDDLVHIPLSKDGVLFQRQSFRPLADLSIRLDYLLYKKYATGYHFTNLLLHLINACFVFLLTREFYKKYFLSQSTNIQALMTCVLFFVYATHSESVFWILGRSGSLGAVFFIPATVFYLWRYSSVVYFVLSLLFMEFGLLAYESVWIFPVVALLLSLVDVRMLGTGFRKEMTFVGVVMIVFA
jgi:hypothetical protein